MTTRVWVAGAMLAGMLVAAQAGAQQPPQQPPQQPQQPQQQPMNAKEAKARFTEKFNAADADHDGKLSRQEAEAGMPEVAKSFDKIDTKKTGFVTQKQIGAYYGAKARQRRGMESPGG
ncbi:hypothetical protein LMG31506_02591 [Cupriavidus yeoncheonensis]|uniref:EF-hand domain-containing protein n=1 Tax=Cupriavidus yeoncheonensis TaxID=1462994 RepID=A0A916N3Q0_9BURK|nr:calcium-binding protein [Cupriavidus yeoncheonensis]CAG2142039.1 hypothetical protein LMG31506_02591 [Cupriavidus yeoncheonensis]